MDDRIRTGEELKAALDQALAQTRFVDFHTHLFPSSFGNLSLSGIDELLIYHYLVAEFHVGERTMRPEQFYSLSKRMQADLVWTKLFIERSPLSEAQIGITSILRHLGINIASRNIDKIREQFENIDQSTLIDKVFELSGLEYLVMTNNIYDAEERKYWSEDFNIDERFRPALRLDTLFTDPKLTAAIMKDDGFALSDGDGALKGTDAKNIQDHLRHWIGIIKPLYVMVSLPPDYLYPDKSRTTQIFDEVLLPLILEERLPLALMSGVKRALNPEYQMAGDGVGKVDMMGVTRLLAGNPQIEFFLTFLSRENQHEATVLSRKFANCHLFGCWWFLNTSSFIEEITDMRLELLGTGFIPQHSDARVLEQLISKWKQARTVIGRSLYKRYAQLISQNWRVTQSDIRNDITNLFKINAERFFKRY